MTGNEKQYQKQAELRGKLWSITTESRGLEIFEHKKYIPSLIFYRYLSEKTESFVVKLLEKNISYGDAWEKKKMREKLAEELIQLIGYVIEPKYLFSNMINEIAKGEQGKFDAQTLQKALDGVIESTVGEDSQEAFKNLFDDMDLNSSNLGRDIKARSKFIAKLMLSVNDIPFPKYFVDNNVLGDAYEYMILQFAENAGKKGGDFYTPKQVSNILSRIVASEKKDLKSVYDPTCGSGSLLLHVGKEAKVGMYYGQELSTTTYNLARMNMIIHDIPYQKFDIKNADTLLNPYHIEKRFEAVVAVPTIGVKWDADAKFMDDERFSPYGKLAPKSKADYAFVQHMIHQLDDNGMMAVVLPHGVLFRGAAEGVIRKYLIEEKNYLDAVIGLPANVFLGTSIPMCILVFKKYRETNDKVLFIDASNDYEQGKNRNYLRDEDVEKIIETYIKRKAIDKYSYMALLDEIRENDYNLNIPRYVDTFVQEEPVDVIAVQQRIKEIDDEIALINKKLERYFKKIGR
ncbi:type I restriction-modification system subunit M [Bacillus thuringiensis]|uniref:type I restriction-modification system subunit M n=1 Tax=Bacillus cereus group TaxID=86661 RepID=UPI000B434322|nr:MULTISPECIES: type I restriction-modification system subunit M [Bacillus cereus group]MDA2273466.1 type I restriction-modification system subunit M [Bacillus cereus]OTX85413.1 type I restriction-modification system subunit M [Bacillus thuringiensis serovar chanpaisis]MED3033438.1 type I restriction-modification system subunit M [Bacillus tropicus]PNK24276.1 type I restriction-modification system subunit M [Bacillus thuringiensis]PNK27435.1 type I restriction-modification system subunit M [B